MGSGRSIAALLSEYQEKSSFNKEFKPPTTSQTTLWSWSSRYDWNSRASIYDAAWEARKNAERDAVMNYGLSLDFERVVELKRLAAFLKSQLYELSAPDDDGVQVFHNIWMPDVKLSADKRVDIERFNASIISEYRAVLADIAKETGGRVIKQETSGEIEVHISDAKQRLEHLISRQLTKGPTASDTESTD